jgi:hypothetical protein
VKNGRKSPDAVFKGLERSAARAAGSARTGKQLRQFAQAATEDARRQVQTPRDRALPLIQRGIVGWAPDPNNNNRATLVMRGTGRKVVDERGRDIVNPAKRFAYTYPKVVDVLAFASHARTAEGDIPWFYLDSESHVTIGRGHLVRGEAEARRLGRNYAFFFGTSPARANVAAVVDAYRRVRFTTDASGRSGLGERRNQNERARAFRDLTTVRLADHAIRALFAADVRQKIREIEARAEFRDYRTYPPEAKLALLDVAFNVGVD